MSQTADEVFHHVGEVPQSIRDPVAHMVITVADRVEDGAQEVEQQASKCPRIAGCLLLQAVWVGST